MSDMDKIEFLRVYHSDNLSVLAVLARYDVILKEANFWHTQAVEKPFAPNIQESYTWYTAQFRMAQQFLDDVYQHLAA